MDTDDTKERKTSNNIHFRISQNLGFTHYQIPPKNYLYKPEYYNRTSVHHVWDAEICILAPSYIIIYDICTAFVKTNALLSIFSDNKNGIVSSLPPIRVPDEVKQIVILKNRQQ